MHRSKRLFSSATAKLTLSYLAVLMVISVFFSSLVFGVASRELDRAFVRPGGIASRLPREAGINREQLEQILSERAQEGRRVLLISLAYVNGLVLVVGGLVSHGLARATLRPIERSHLAQSQFASDASHELRTPLASIKTEIEVALKDPSLDITKARALLRSNLEEIHKLTRLSEGLLRLAQADSKETVVRPTALDEVLGSALERVKTRAQSKNIQLEQKGEWRGLVVKADPASLEELFVVLLDNAINYSDEGSVVSLQVELHGQHVHCSVSDSGPGIAQADQQKIFERFYRAGYSKQKGTPHGYGLGLAIAQSIAHAHKTKVTVASRPSEGSTFTIELKRQNTDTAY